MSNREWRVVVTSTPAVGDIGSVTAEHEDEARCAALSKFSQEGDRPKATNGGWSTERAIFEDDDFSVIAS